MKAVVGTLLFVSCLNAMAQDWAKVSDKPVATEVVLRVGDHVPAELHNMINYPAKTLKFSDHKPKLLLLDFWATTCGPCIKFWPTALKLREEFGSDLEIIPVNSYENANKVKDFLARRKRIDGFEMTLPISCRDSAVWKNFPGASLPRYVWIDDNGIIGAITDGKEMTRENVKKWITEGPFKMKNLDERKFYSVTPWEPIYLNGNGGEKTSDVFVWTSSLTKGQNDNPANGFIYYDVRGYGITVTNSPISHLYGFANNYRLRESDIFDFLPIGRMELIATDTSKYYGDGSLNGNAFNYQLISGRPKTRKQLMTMMQQDLDRYFGLEVKWEKRLKKCLVISMFDSTLATRKKSLGGELKMRDKKIIVDSAVVKDLTTLMEMATWNYRNWKYPIVDETNYKGLITGLREEGNGEDPAFLDKVLTKYGMRLKFEMREVDILVLRERD